VLAAAREAFVQGLQLTAALSAAVAVATAVMATVLLRSVPAGTQAEQPAPAAEPGLIILGEDAFQVIRSGSGCMACPASADSRRSTMETADHTGKAAPAARTTPLCSWTCRQSGRWS
jgi:hypothetical protein